MAKVRYYLNSVNITGEGSVAENFPFSVQMPTNTEFVSPRVVDGLSLSAGAAAVTRSTGSVPTASNRDMLLGVFRFVIPTDKRYTWVGHSDNSNKIKLALGKQTASGGTVTNGMSVVANMYVYNPTTNAVVGYIQDTVTAMSGSSQNDWPGTASSVCAVGLLGGATTAAVGADEGMWIVLELWGKRSTTSASYSIIFDGTDTTLADGDSGGNYASYIEVDETIEDFSGGGGTPPTPPASTATYKVLILDFTNEEDPVWFFNVYGTSTETKPNCVCAAPNDLSFGRYSMLIGCGAPNDTGFGFVLGQIKQLHRWPTLPSNYAVDVLGLNTQITIQAVMELKPFTGGIPTEEKEVKTMTYTYEMPPTSVGASELDLTIYTAYKPTGTGGDYVSLEARVLGSGDGWSTTLPSWTEHLLYLNQRTKYMKIKVVHATKTTGNAKGRLYFSGLYIDYLMTGNKLVNTY